MKHWNVIKKVTAICLSAVMLIAPVSGAEQFSLNVQAEEKVSSQKEVNDAMKLWYTSPANINTAETSGGEWMQQALPLGNGNLGNLIFGGVSKERIHFNEKTLWTGGPSASRPNYQFGNKNSAYSAEEIEEYRQILDDKTRNVFNDSMSGYGYVPIRFSGASNLYKGEYQDFGDLWLDFSAMGITESNVSDYRRELNLQKGIAATSFTYQGVEYKREHFVSNPDNVMVTNVTASENGKLNITIQMELNNGGLSGTTTLNSAENTCTIAGVVSDNGLKFRTTMKVIPTGGTIKANSNNTYTVTGADSLLIVMAAETDYKNDYPTYRDSDKDLSAVVEGRVKEAAGKSFDELKANHLEDHQALFDRVSLDLGEVNTKLPTNELMDAYRKGDYSKYLEVLSFQFGRYLSIAGSRGTLPSNLVGLWTVGGSAWTGDYHFNVNVQMNYWPVYVTNLAECGTTMVEYMENLREPGRLTAERIHGIEGAVDDHTGFVVHTENNPFGMTAPSNAQEYGWNPTGAAWAIQNLWAHYEFTQDLEYLKNVIYPIMKEAALFWDQYLWVSDYQVINDENSLYNGQARLVVAPSFSEEQGPTAIGTTYDQSLVWELYKECVEAGKLVGEDTGLLQQWEDIMQRLDPIEINATNGIKEWYEETRVGLKNGHHQSYAKAGSLSEIAVPNSGWNIGHPGEQRHASHLVGLYPGTLINKENEEYMSAAIQSLTERGVYSTGWSKANKINLWARTGNGDMAYTLLNNLIGGNTAGLQYNLFDSHGSGGGETMKNGTPVWQIDGNYGLTAGMAEMLLQSQLDYVQFLPALPKAWDEGSVQGLKARGNFTIGQRWYNGVASEFTVCYDGDETSSEFIGEYSEITNAKVYLNGKEIKVSKDLENGQISFYAVRGKTYTIDMSGTNGALVKDYAQLYVDEIHQDLTEAKKELVQAIAETDENLNEILRKVKLMNEIYTKYLAENENIYYMTTEEGLTDKEIDTMYDQLSQFKKALLENTGDLAYFENIAEIFEHIREIMQEQMENREISFVRNGTELSIDTDSERENYVIRYTLDGSTPCFDSEIYEKDITIENGQSCTIKAALFLEEQRVSPVYYQQYVEKQKFDSAETTEANWDGFGPALMIDGDSGTRWASKDPSGPVEIVLGFERPTTINGMIFEQYVSYRNAIDKFEIWALQENSYQKIYDGTDLGDENDATGQYFASKTINFDKVTTDSVKVLIPAGYVGEPSFWEIKPVIAELENVEKTDFSSLEEMILLSEKIDKNSQNYKKAEKALKNAFDGILRESKAAVQNREISQALANSMTVFLSDRYERILLGETTENSAVFRIAGSGRYETGYKVADTLKETLGVEKFDTVVVATGKNFADALSGSYLAVVRNAPILLTNGKDDNVAQLHKYIKENVSLGGTIYILGGTGAVPASVESISGYDTIRLSGVTRYDTNLAILKEAGITGDQVIVATGKSFADSLSASAAKLPILLAKPGAALSAEAKEILKDMEQIYVIGGEGAVSSDTERELSAYGKVIRVSGSTRYETSIAVAETFFETVEKSVVASGKNFPDGLCGGPLAAAMDAPLILTADGKSDPAEDYMRNHEIFSGMVLGGTGALGDKTVITVFDLENEQEIIIK